MVGNLKKTNQKGFTIIEVLIVLAIAGLIMVLVFLAVPALQRNSRNTSARTEAANLLGSTNEFITNNGGSLPVAGSGPTIVTGANTKVVTSLVVEAEAGTTVPVAATPVLRTGAKCNANNNETDPGSARRVALLYVIESQAGVSTVTCTSS